MDLSVRPQDDFFRYERQVGRQHAHPRRSVRLWQLCDAARARPERAGGDRGDHRQERSAESVRPRRESRRAAALLGGCRCRPAQLRTIRRADLAIGSRHARSRLLPAQRREVRGDPQGVCDLHLTALRPRQSARSGGRRGAHHRARNDDRKTAVGSRAQPRSQRHLQQDERERAAGVDTGFRLAGVPLGDAGRRERQGQGRHRPAAGLHEGDRRRHRGSPARHVEGVPDLRADQRVCGRVVAAVCRFRLRVQRQDHRRTAGAAAAVEARRQRRGAGAR